MKILLSSILFLSFSVFANDVVKVPVEFKPGVLNVKHFNKFLEVACVSEDCSQIVIQNEKRPLTKVLSLSDFELDINKYGEKIPAPKAEADILASSINAYGEYFEDFSQDYKEGRVGGMVGNGALILVETLGAPAWMIMGGGELAVVGIKNTFRTDDIRIKKLKADEKRLKRISSIMKRIVEGGEVKLNTYENLISDLEK